MSTREVWVTLLSDVEQVGLIELDPQSHLVDHLRKAVKVQFELHTPPQRLLVFLPDLTKPASSEGRFLTQQERPLPPNHEVEEYLVPPDVQRMDRTPGHSYETALLIRTLRAEPATPPLPALETNCALTRHRAEGSGERGGEDQLLSTTEDQSSVDRRPPSSKPKAVDSTSIIEAARSILVALGVDLLAQEVQLSRKFPSVLILGPLACCFVSRPSCLLC